ncbi:MAG: alpha/beta hydrolase-fold protein [Lacipirellulaceae bacterium]
MLSSALASLPSKLPAASFHGGPTTWTTDETVEPSRRIAQEPTDHLFSPVGYEAGYRYPLIVWMHSHGSSERELTGVMASLSLQNHVAIAPRGTDRMYGEDGLYTWRQNPTHIDLAAKRVEDAIARAQQVKNIHPDRVFVVGYGSGGTMALRIALRHPEWFAGVASLNGPMPTGFSPLGRFKAARRLPVMLGNGLESEHYDVDSVYRDVRLLRTAGMKLDVRHFPAGDELRTPMLEEINAWIMNFVCSSSSSAVPQSV